MLEVIDQSTAIRSVEEDPVAGLLRQFENRAKHGDFEPAANSLMLAIGSTTGRTKQIMTDWRTSLQRSADLHGERLATVTDENRVIIAELREWERNADEVILSLLDQAISYVQDGNASVAAMRLRRGAEGMPRKRGDDLRRLAHRLDHPSPRLGPGDFAELDWNARLGIMKAMAEATRESGEAAQEALRGNYDQAAELAQGTAQNDFAEAARRQQAKRADRVKIPPAFAQPRVPIDLLKMKHLRRQLIADRPRFLNRAAADLRAAGKQVKVAMDHAKANRIREATAIILKLKPSLALIEARRHLLGESNVSLESLRSQAQQPTARRPRNVTSLQKGLKALHNALSHLEAELQAETQAAVNEMKIAWRLDDLSAKITVAAADPKVLTEITRAADRLRTHLIQSGSFLAKLAGAQAFVFICRR